MSEKTQDRYEFPINMDMDEVTEWIGLAVVDAKWSLGTGEVQGELMYFIDTENNQVVIDMSTETGKHVSKIFGALVERAKSSEKWKLMMDARTRTKKIDWDRVREPIEMKGSRGSLKE